MPENIIDTTIPVLGESKVLSPILTSPDKLTPRLIITSSPRLMKNSPSLLDLLR